MCWRCFGSIGVIVLNETDKPLGDLGITNSTDKAPILTLSLLDNFTLNEEEDEEEEETPDYTKKKMDDDDESEFSDFVPERAAGTLVGLKNQGATCYLNSLIQSLYMTPEFRRIIYS